MNGTSAGTRPGSVARALGVARELLRTVRWTASIVWATNRGAALGLLIVILLRSTVAAGLALAARGLINAAAQEVHAGTGRLQPLVWWLIAALILGLVEAIGPMAGRLFHISLADDLNLRVTADVLEHAASLDLATLEDPERRELVDEALQAPAAAVSAFVYELQSAVTDCIQVLLLFLIVARLEPLVLAVGLFAVPYLAFQWSTAKRRHTYDVARVMKRRWARYFSSMLTSVGSAGEVQLLGLAPHFIDRFRSLMARFRDEDRRLHRRDFTGGSIFALLTITAFYATFARVALRVMQGALTIGDIAVFAAVGPRLRYGIDRTIVAFSAALQHALAIQNLRAFMDMRGAAPSAPRQKSEVGSQKSVQPTEQNSEVRSQNSVHQSAVLPLSVVPTPVTIDVDDVWFTYPGADRPALSGVSLHIRAGETVAFVGENGAGKTTLVKLIARLYDPERGRVAIDSRDARDWPLDALHACIALVPQSATRFEATAADNIAFGRWRTLLADRAAVEQVARTSGADALIRSLPEGYDTVLGRSFGTRDLSGGQWQQLTVARALARDASILILDEPAANLDARAEHQLFSRFGRLARGRTTIIVSHRLATLSLADRIFVLDEGRLVESGTHDALLAQGGRYAELHELHHRPLAVE